MTLSIKQAMQVLANGEQISDVAAAIITEENKIARLWVGVASAIALSPFPIATATELEQALRAQGYEKQALSNRCKAVAGHLQSAGLSVYWHRAGKAGPGAVATFHSHPCPLEMKKAEKAAALAAMEAKKAELKALEAAAKEAEKAGQHEKQAAALAAAAEVKTEVQVEKEAKEAATTAAKKAATAAAIKEWREVGVSLLVQGLITEADLSAMLTEALALVAAARMAA